MSIEIGPIVEIGTNPIEVEEIFSTTTEVIGPTRGIEVDQGIIGMGTITEEAIMPKTIEEITIDRTMVITGAGIEIEVSVRIAAGQGKDIGAILEITIETGHIIEVKIEIEERESRNRDRSSSRKEDKGQEQNLEIEIKAGKRK